MSGPFVNNDEGQCPKAEWFRGCKQPRDPGMPERAWGAYLPGDEPHWQCAVTGEPCDPESLTCPLWHKTGLWCPECFSEGHIAKLFFHEGTEGLRCARCGWNGEEESRVEAWKELREDWEGGECICQ